MNAGMKMLMLTNAKKGENGRYEGRMDAGRYEDTRMGYGGAEGLYSAENRFRDRRGRKHYDNGRFAPENGYEQMETRMGYGYGETGEKHEQNGRMEMSYPSYPFPESRGGEQMNQIGFRVSPEVDHNYSMEAGYHGGSEMEYRNSPMSRGQADVVPRFTKETAEEWVRSMENEDGTKGAHWTIEQVKQVMAQRGVNLDPVQFWVSLNAIYSDFGKVLKKHGIGDKIDLYVDLAKAFMEDKDAQPDKLARYYQYVVRH